VIAPAGSNTLTLSSTELTAAGETISFNLGATAAGITIDGSAGDNELLIEGPPPASLTLVNILPANAPPTAHAGGPYAVVRGSAVTLDASDTNDAEDSNTALTYDWDFDGDGEYDDATGITTTFSADGLNTPGQRPVGLRVTDSGGRSATATATVQVHAMAVLPDPLVPGSTMLAVGGTTSNDLIAVTPGLTSGSYVATIITPTSQGLDLTVGVFRPGSGAWELDLDLCGVSLGLAVSPTSGPVSRIVVYGQSGHDDMTVSASVGRSAWLYGGDGNDRLKTGANNNVLLGGAGNDLLTGGNGRDILIGGAGADRIVGNAQDDILIAGWTAFDTDESALSAIRTEWTRTDRTYQQRHLALNSDGVGPDFAIRLDDTTVSDDGVLDVLTGSSGQDWFLVNLVGGGIHDKVTDLSASEFADDLEFINS
jgi:Ca2+-binding RTX toxin-like protein